MPGIGHVGRTGERGEVTTLRYEIRKPDDTVLPAALCAQGRRRFAWEVVPHAHAGPAWRFHNKGSSWSWRRMRCVVESHSILYLSKVTSVLFPERV